MRHMSERRKNISTSFTVFLNTFLIISTVIIFAVLLFLSLRNMIDTKIDDTMGEAADICTYVSADIGDYIAHSESADDAIDGINRYLSSSVLTSKGQIWIIDGDTDVLFTNRNSDPESFALDDSAVDLVISLRDSDNTFDTSKMRTSSFAICRSISRIEGTSLFCLVELTASLSEVRSEYANTILLPALVSMLVAIVVFIGFTGLMMRPVKEISRAISGASEGDYSARVSDKITNYSDLNSFAVSSELSLMGRTVNNMLETLENQEKDREVFISSVAHDIRTPLTSINGFITAMIDGTIPKDRQEQYLVKIKNEVDRIRKLIVSMTEASSLSHVDPSMMEEFDVADVICDITENLEPQLKEKKITAVKDLGSGPHMCYGEAQQLCRVIVNIVTNAIKFTPEGGKIKISLEPDNKARKVMIRVEDSGPGVEPEKRNRVFESFYKADPSRKQEGFGLGLYICKQILAGHDQTISLDESPELGGARFNFTFPYPPEDTDDE